MAISAGNQHNPLRELSYEVYIRLQKMIPEDWFGKMNFILTINLNILKIIFIPIGGIGRMSIVVL